MRIDFIRGRKGRRGVRCFFFLKQQDRKDIAVNIGLHVAATRYTRAIVTFESK